MKYERLFHIFTADEKNVYMLRWNVTVICHY